jgi:hypothetical protein
MYFYFIYITFIINVLCMYYMIYVCIFFQHAF